MPKKQKKKIWVALLNMGTTSAGLETRLYKWMQDLAGVYSFYFTLRTERPISSNRNHIVKDFLASDSDVLVMVDDDNPPLQNPFELVRHNKDVIAIPTPGRDDFGVHWHVYTFKEVDYPKKIEYDPFKGKRKGLTRVDAVSTGCIIVKRKVLEKIKRPFEDLFDENGIILSNDDLHFSWKCKQAGFEIWVDWDKFCSHYKTVDLLQMLRLFQIAKREGRGERNFVTIKQLKRKEPINGKKGN